jgi:hypothetical protein
MIKLQSLILVLLLTAGCNFCPFRKGDSVSINVETNIILVKGDPRLNKGMVSHNDTLIKIKDNHELSKLLLDMAITWPTKEQIAILIELERLGLLRCPLIRGESAPE